MAEFINTVDSLGDIAVFDSIVDRTITEFKDNRATKVRANAFRNCTALTTVVCPNVVEIGNSAFANCTSLTSVDCPNANPLSGSFNKCSALTSANFPLATRIGDSVFADCTSLSAINLPKVTAIDGSGLNKTAITIVDFPALTYLGGYALANSPLKALVLRSQTAATLSNVNALQNTDISKGTGYIYVPSALVDSYKTAANWSTYANQFRKLEDWTVDGTVAGELAIEGRYMVRFFDEDGTLLYYTIVNSGEDAAYVGDAPTKEGEWEFTGWTGVTTNVTVDTDVYAQYRFTGSIARQIVNRSISGDYVNDRVKTIGAGAFQSCSALTSVDLPSVTTIDHYAFYGSGNIKSVILRNASAVCTLTGQYNYYFNSSCYIYVPKALINSYKTANRWKNITDQLRAIEDYTVDGTVTGKLDESKI